MFYYFDNLNYLGIHLNGLLIKEEKKEPSFITYSNIKSVAIDEFSKESFIMDKSDKMLAVDINSQILKIRINNRDDIFGILRLINYAIRFFAIRMAKI